MNLPPKSSLAYSPTFYVSSEGQTIQVDEKGDKILIR